MIKKITGAKTAIKETKKSTKVVKKTATPTKSALKPKTTPKPKVVTISKAEAPKLKPTQAKITKAAVSKTVTKKIENDQEPRVASVKIKRRVQTVEGWRRSMMKKHKKKIILKK